MELFFSIITPIYNRENEILDLIDSIINQSISSKNYELIIVDDGSTDGSINLIENKIKSSNIDIFLIKQKNNGPGSARNKGMENARGNFFLFIDSDCEADKDWLKEILNAYDKFHFDAFGGPDSSKENYSVLQKSIDFSMNSFFTTGGLRGNAKRLAKFYPRSHNMGIKSSLFEKLGGFGSLRHGQDIEFSNRIIKNKSKVVFLSKVIVYHRRRTSIKFFFKQVFNWGIARVNLGVIDKKMFEPIHFIPSIASLTFFLTFIATFINPHIFSPILVFFLSSLILISLFGSIKIKNIKSLFLLIIIIPIQIFGYGIGFIYNFTNRFLLKNKEYTGFTKKYYK